MKNNKGFTLIEILAVVVLLGILMAAALIAYTRYIEYSRNKSYKILRDSVISAADNYVMDHPGEGIEDATGKKIKTTIDIQTLVEYEYLESATDPSDKTSKCTGEIIVTENKENNKISSNSYKVVMCCKRYNIIYERNEKGIETKNQKFDTCQKN